jgi:predicted ArsR family transcriptional regulator
VPTQDDLAALAELAEPMRQRVYDYVATSRATVSKDDASRALGIGRSLASYHLERLLRAGLLTASYARRTGRSGPGAGRTAKLYTTSTRDFETTLPPRDYEQIGQLLAAAIDHDTSGTARAAAEATAYDQGRAAGAEANGVPAVDVLRDRGYQPVPGDGGVVRLANCPFDALAQQHRELVCAINHAFLRGLLQGLGADQATAHLDPQPHMCCVALHNG